MHNVHKKLLFDNDYTSYEETENRDKKVRQTTLR